MVCSRWYIECKDLQKRWFVGSLCLCGLLGPRKKLAKVVGICYSLMPWRRASGYKMILRMLTTCLHRGRKPSVLDLGTATLKNSHAEGLVKAKSSSSAYCILLCPISYYTIPYHTIFYKWEHP